MILAIIVASLFSLFAGGTPHGKPLPLDTPLPPLQPFWAVFAVFFPAVTGILSGVSMSGDLRDPARAIPWGTLSAVLVSYVAYLLIPFFLHHVVADRRLLLLDTMIMRDVARWGWLILAGVWAASLSSALGSFLAAPRTLQALARDGVLPLWIARGGGSGNDPRLATLLTLGIAAAAVSLGALNAIASVLTMFFLTTYGVINLCAGMEEILGSPSWRPTFRVRAWMSLAGMVGCAIAMVMIDAGAAIISGSVVAGVYLLIKRRGIRRQWGDIRYGLLMLMIRTALYRLVKKRRDARSWQPNILVLCGAPTSRSYLIELANALAGDSNCLTVATVLPVESWSAERIEDVGESIRHYLQTHGIAGLVKVLPEDNLQTGAEALIKAYGFGPVTPNTIILGETEKFENFRMFASLIRLIRQSRRNLIMVREGICELDPEVNPRIDIWWKSDSENIGLMMLLGYLLKRSRDWPDAQLNVKTVVPAHSDLADAGERLAQFAKMQRIELLTAALSADGRDAFDVIRESSRQAGLVFVGMRPPGERETDEEYSRYYAWLLEQTRGLPTTAIVMAAEAIDFRSMYRR